MPAMKKVSVTYKGGPRNGQTGEMPATALSNFTKPARVFACAKEAKKAKMFGVYLLNDTRGVHALVYEWKDTSKGASKVTPTNG